MVNPLRQVVGQFNVMRPLKATMRQLVEEYVEAMNGCSVSRATLWSD